MDATDWKIGDRVVHAERPEWGAGEVRSAQTVTESGRRCQRLTIRFDRGGVRTLSTMFAQLRSAGELESLERAAAYAEESPEPSPDLNGIVERLQRVPEAATDPFRTRRARLEATLGLYRFTGQGASLLDWAASQTGLKDPLSRFNRHELEHQFDRFRANLDAHLKRLALEIRREAPGAIAELSRSAPPAAQQALRRLDVGR